MPLFDFFKKKKDGGSERSYVEQREAALSERDRKRPKKVENYVLSRLEDIIQATRELEEQKAEYRVITSYLNDIKEIEQIPAQDREQISDVASNIISLNRARNEFLRSDQKITDAQYSQFQREEKDIPEAIKRLKANEIYLDALEQELRFIDREKDEWTLRKVGAREESKRMVNAIYIAVGASISLAILIGIFQIVMENVTTLAWTVLAFLAALGICIPYIKILNANAEVRRADVNIRYAVSMSNKVKFKYVNMKNAVDYSCEKYHVRNSEDMNAMWEAYMEAVRQREKFERNNDDLEYYSNRLIRMLEDYHLYDAEIWVPQAEALVNQHEMVEVSHRLIGQRQKLRSRIEDCAAEIKAQRNEMNELLRTVHPKLRPQVQEIIQSIDRLSKA